MKVVNPILLVPGSSAPWEHVDAVRKAIPMMQAWWEMVGGCYVQFADPKTPTCKYFGDRFINPDGTVRPDAYDWPYERGLMGRGEVAIVFLLGLKDWHGEASNRVAVVSYQVVERLSQANFDGIPTVGNQAAGLISHEVGHLLGLGHLEDAPGELMSSAAFWQRWPACSLSVRPA